MTVVMLAVAVVVALVLITVRKCGRGPQGPVFHGYYGY